MTATRRSTVGALAAATLLLAAAGCVDERKVFVERPFFEQPTSAAAGFLGYTDTTTAVKQTACGNCHVGHQADWKQTGHSHAWADLQASGHAAESCEACHTISQAGNGAASANVGYTATKDARYLDVQCESCHGAGLEHAQKPDGNVKPLASLAADTGALAAGGCGACHQGSHHPFVEEWRASRHALLEDHPTTTASCMPCHTAQSVLAGWGVTAQYKEMNAPVGQQHAITCVVCHDPHSDKFPAQTRFSVSVMDQEDNLCMKCHHKRGELDPTTSRGAHSPEGPMILGTAGWIPPGATFQKGQLKGTHSTGQLCVTCHMSTGSFATDTKGNSNIGHTFQATPCVDGAGKFVGGTCEDAQRSYKGCTASGCHASETAARSAYATGELRIAGLVAETNRLIALVPKSEIKQDAVITVAEGAIFNVTLGQAPGAAAHNPFLMEALLTSGIKALKTTYNLTSTPGIVLNNVLKAGQ